MLLRLLPLGPNDNNNNDDGGGGNYNNYNNGNDVGVGDGDGDGDSDNDSDGRIVDSTTKQWSRGTRKRNRSVWIDRSMNER